MKACSNNYVNFDCIRNPMGMIHSGIHQHSKWVYFLGNLRINWVILQLESTACI
jgi:hypothetical protein